MRGRFDVPELSSTSTPAFAWVARELTLPDDATRIALLDAFVLHRHSGFEKLVRELRKVWPPGAQWPIGDAYLRSADWLALNEHDDGYQYSVDELVELLAGRLCRVAHRLFRDVQVRALVDPESPDRSNRYTHICINRDHFHDEERNACGIRPGSLVSIEAGLFFLREPAHKHPACDCTADPSPV